jgi:asparagine synthase (glutamine-hydrolysing)
MAPRGVGGAYRAVRGLFGLRDLQQLGALEWVGELDALSMFTPDDPEEPDVRDAVASLELQRYLRNQLLRDTDAMSMAHSLEVRVPLLDDDVVDVALATPADLRNRSGKAMLQEAAGFARTGPKRGFTLPFDAWMRGALREPVQEFVLSDGLPFSWLISQQARASLWRAFEDGHVHWSRPWSLAILRMWAVQHGYRW